METTKSGVTTGGWYFQLLDKVNELVRRFGLPEDIAGDIQRLTIEVARTQFKAGNMNGISWLKREQAKHGILSKAPVAT